MEKEKKYLKVFIAGLAFPATILPFIYSSLFLSGHNAVINIPVQFIPHYLPIIFGLWNMLYFAIGEKCPIKNKYRRLLAWGALLGLIATLIGIFIIGLPELLYGLTGPLQYLPLIVVPIFYGLIWRYVVSSLNDLLGLETG
jgi:hypothetical protein